MPWLPLLLQCSDTAFPTGGFAHSGGLEGLAQLGHVTDIDTLRDFLRGPVLHNLQHVDLPLVAHSYRAALRGDDRTLARLDDLSCACRVPEELREAARRSGRQRLELLANALGQAGAFRPARTQAPVVSGIEAAHLGMPEGAALAGFAFQTLSGVTAAALKALRLGQTALQSALAEVLRDVPAAAARAARLAEDDIGSFAPAWDIASCRHRRAPSRLFLS